MQHTDFIMTMDATNILGLCNVTEKVNGIGVVIGNAGTGKTFTLKRYTEGSGKAVYLRADSLMSCRNLIRCIAEKCGFDVSIGSVWEMKNSLIDFLQENPKTLIIDEADKLFQVNSIK